MSGHTPGPWRTYQEDSNSVRVLSDDYGRIVTLHRAPYDPTDIEANARLIAKAPTMWDIIVGRGYCPDCGAGTSFAPEDGRQAMAGDGNPVVYCEAACGFETTLGKQLEAADRVGAIRKEIATP